MKTSPTRPSSLQVRQRGIARYILPFLVVVFIFASVVGGSLLHLYDAFWWWDDMLHTIAGAMLATVGLIVVSRFHPGTLRPGLVALFMFCFAVAGGALWEIFEFFCDLTLHTAMQQWDMPPQAIVMGASYQGMGLRDTMSDITMGTIGALIATIIIYVTYTKQPTTVLSAARRLYPWHRS